MSYFRGHFPTDIEAAKNAQRNEESLAAIRGRKEGPPDWWWVGRDFPKIPRCSRPDNWELTGPSFWALLAAKDSLFSEPLPARYRGG